MESSTKKLRVALSFELRMSHHPNQSFQGTKTRALRGFCPLNSNR